ncbi:MAG: hypothetical protein JWO22_26 [Frankiales bacterium]|nr:hypothetical protein [Frankiales bacterium]
MTAQPSRRALLLGSAAGVAALGVVASQESDAAETAAGTAASTHALPVSHDAALHAARRLSYGATPALVAKIRSMGVSAWVDEQLSGAPDLNATLHGTGLASLPLPPNVMNQAMGYAGHYGITDLQAQTFAKAAFGDNQLFEVLVEVFTNHLSIFGPTWAPQKAQDDTLVIRKHVLGSFADMLAASAQSPAMLLYLNQAYSIGSDPNENYARELMELHTVGVNGGYTQRDVHNAALALTGLTVDPNTGDFAYNPQWHHVGPVRVMGWHSANSDQSKGKDVALSLVSYLAHHPSTARRIATKLVRRLVADNPPAALVASAAAVYRVNGTQIVPVVKHIIASKAFQQSWGQKSQRPYEWFVQAVRVLGVQPSPTLATDGGAVVNQLRQLGQAPFEWSPPNGYPDNVTAYASTSTMLARWNAAQHLVHGSINGLQKPGYAALLGSPAPTTAGALVDRLATRLVGGRARAGLKQGVLTGVGLKATHVVTQAAAEGLVPPMAALLLSSPEAMVR